eukprot:gene5954-4278_t
MSEIASVLQFLGEVVYHIFDFSLNVAATVFGVASAILPWRWGEIYFILTGDEDGWKFRCLFSFFVTVVDLVAVPCLLLGVLSPMRWHHVGKTAGKYLACTKDAADDCINYRGSALLTLVLVLADLFTLPFVALVLLSPFGRQFGLLTFVLTKHHATGTRYDDDDEDFYWNTLYVWYGADSALDVLSFFLAPLVVCAPSTWPSLCRIFPLIWRDAPAMLTAADRTMSTSRYCESIADFHTALRVCVVEHGLLALCDAVAALPFLFAFVSPLRHAELMALVWPPRPPTSVATGAGTAAPLTADEAAALDISAPLPPGQQPAAAPVFAQLDRVVPDAKEPDFALRMKIIRLGLLAMADVLLYPMLAALWATRYRYHCIAALLTADNRWGTAELYTVAKQFCCLLLDGLCFAAPVAFVWATRLRWPPLQRALQRDETLRSGNCEFYALVLQQLLLLCVDALTLPLLLVLVATGYRFVPLVPVLRHRDCFARGLRVNALVALNVLVVLHDVVFVLPYLVLTVALLGFARLHVLCYRYESQRAYRAERQQLLRRYDAQRRPLPPGTAAAATAAEDEAHPPTDEPFDDVVERSHADYELRWAVWGALFDAACDVPFVLLGGLVLLSLWRAAALLRGMRRVFAETALHALPPHEKCYALRRRLSQCRALAAEQSARLVVDVAMLLPLTLVLATVYRAPALLMDLLALALEAATVLGRPLFDVQRAQVTWRPATDPVVTVQLTPFGSDAATAAADDDAVFGFDAVEHFQLTLVGDEVWRETQRALGGVVTSVARSLLPLKLRRSADAAGFVRHAAVEHGGSVADGEGPDAAAGLVRRAAASDVWFRLPLAAVKRSTVAKKLRLLAPDTPLVFQLAAHVPSRASAAEPVATTLRPLVYVSLTAAELLRALTTTTTTTPAAAATAAADETVPLPAAPLTGEAFHRLDAAMRLQATAGSAKVDAFATIVARHFAAVAVDAAHALLFVFLVASPWRLVQCLQRLFCDDRQLYALLARDCWRNVAEADFHLRQLRDLYLPLLSEHAKAQRARFAEGVYGGGYGDYGDYGGYGGWRSGWTDDAALATMERRQRFAIAFHLQRYASLMRVATYQATKLQQLPLDARDVASGRPVDAAQLEALAQLQQRVFGWLLARYALWATSPAGAFARRAGRREGEAAPARQSEEETQQKLRLAALVLVDEHDRVVRAMQQQLAAVERSCVLAPAAAAPAAEETASWWTRLRRGACGLRVHPLHQALVRRMARRVCSDWAGVAFAAALLLTVVEVVPLLRSLLWRPPRVGVKSVMLFHVQRVGATLWQLARLAACLAVLVVTVAGLPHFVDDVASASGLRRDTSLEDLADVAARHVRRVAGRLWELLSLVTALKTYRILAKSALYALLLPGAVIADALGTWLSTSAASLSRRFTVGSCLFGGVFVAALVLVSSPSLRARAGRMNDAALALLGVCVALQVAVGLLAHWHPANRRCYATVGGVGGVGGAALALRLQWSHVLALVVAAVDWLALSAVVLFFFWAAPSQGGAAPGRDLSQPFASLLGTDELSRLLVWNAVDEASGAAAMRTEVSLAAFAVVVWAALVAVPLVQGGDTADRRHAKSAAVLHHPTYRALCVVFGELLAVWVIATLLRPTSCVDGAGGVAGAGGGAVMSTQLSYDCGAARQFDLGRAALPLLRPRPRPFLRAARRHGAAAAALTATATRNRYRYTATGGRFDRGGAHDADAARRDADAAGDEVRVHPTYRVAVRAAQTLLCAGASASSASRRASPCSRPSSRCASASRRRRGSRTPRRAPRAVAAAATATRTRRWRRCARRPSTSVGAIAAVAAAVVVRRERRRAQRWQAQLAASGVAEALQRLAALYRLVASDFFASARRGSRQRDADDAAQWQRVWRAAAAGSLPGLVRLATDLEARVPIDRVSRDFLAVRARWLAALDAVLVADDAVDVFDASAVHAPDVRGVEVNYATHSVASNDDVWAAFLRRARSADADGRDATVAAGGAAPTATAAVDAEAARSWRDVQRANVVDIADPATAAAVLAALDEDDAAAASTVAPRASPPAAAAAAAGSPASPASTASPVTRRLAALRDLVAVLQVACHDVFTTTYVSRAVLATLLSYRRVPREVAWLVFSYVVDLRHVRDVLVYRAPFAESRQRLRQRQQRAPQPPLSEDAQRLLRQVAQIDEDERERVRGSVSRFTLTPLTAPGRSVQRRVEWLRNNVAHATAALESDLVDVFAHSVAELSGEAGEVVYR